MKEAVAGHKEIAVKYVDGQNLFAAKVSQGRRKASTASKLFESQEDFVSFIKGGLSSYTPSLKQGRFSRVDLVEDSNHYVPIDATIKYSALDDVWKDAELTFDSAFHAGGGLYRLKYRGAAGAHLLEPIVHAANS